MMRYLLHIVRFVCPQGVPDRHLSRPCAVHDALGKQVWNFPSVMGCFSSQSGLRCISSSRCCIGGRQTHPSRAALRLGTAAVVKRSAGQDVASESLWGSVVTPESFNPLSMGSGGFGSAAGFSVLKWAVQGCST